MREVAASPAHHGWQTSCRESQSLSCLDLPAATSMNRDEDKSVEGPLPDATHDFFTMHPHRSTMPAQTNHEGR